VEIDRLAGGTPGALADAPSVGGDAFDRWIESNYDELARHRDEFVAIHPRRGIVFSAPDDETFGRWVVELPEAEANEFLITHAGKYV